MTPSSNAAPPPPPPSSGTPGAPLATPLATPPDDVVHPTPAPFTPMSTPRRELGTLPVRLTPSSPATPNTPAAEQRTDMLLWGTTINMDDADNRLTDFIRTYRTSGATPAASGSASPDGEPAVSDAEPFYIDQLRHLAETGSTILNVNMSHLHVHDASLYTKLLMYPNELITLFDAVVTRIFTEQHPTEADQISNRLRKPPQIRVYNMLPRHLQSMRTLNPNDISHLVAVRGMVIRASPVIPDIQRAMYRCQACRSMKDVMIAYGRIDEPRKCQVCNTKDSYVLVHSRSTFSDKQMVRLQEAPEAIPKGDTPATFTLVMYDSLVDAVKPGDRVEVTGILRATPIRVNPKLRLVRSVFRTYIDCVHIRTLNNNQARMASAGSDMAAKDATGQLICDDDTIGEACTDLQLQKRAEVFDKLACHPRLYERLADSLAPSIFGMTDEKKGVLLQLFGGASKTAAGGANEEEAINGSARFRSAINILLVGDPGTSKSQLLHSAHRLAPRGVYTSGRGSSAVGLTAYVTRDPDTDDFVLESGALVLSDRGVCCIDEFDKMSEFARSVLHEAMEQQTVSIAKAGIIATLNARTAVLAAANPLNSRYDTSKSVVENIDLPPTLLSRFDLIYLVLDAPNADADRKLAKHIVSLFFKNYNDGAEGDEAAPAVEQTATEGAYVGDDLDVPVAPAYGSGDLLDAKTLTEYIAYTREKVDPRLSTSAAEALVSGYVDMRAGGRGGGNITATPRQLESLIRLAEAHARMQLKEEVDDTDVAEAMRLVKSALHMAAYDPNTGKIDMNLFAAGKARAADGMTEFLAKAVLEVVQKEGKDVMTDQLLKTVRSQSDGNVAAGDLREALRMLEEREQIVLTKGGTVVKLV